MSEMSKMKPADFQQKSVEAIWKKLYVEEKKAVVLADEVGMGKTFVCKGLIEKLESDKKKNDEKFTVIYISPGRDIAEQNYRELCAGFEGLQKNVDRIAFIKENETGKANAIYAISQSMFLCDAHSPEGTDTERQEAAKYVCGVLVERKRTEPRLLSNIKGADNLLSFLKSNGVKRVSVSEDEVNDGIYILKNELNDNTDSIRPYRLIVNMIKMRRIEPDLIIFDEFHKYLDENAREVITKYYSRIPSAKFVFVSATPYKMSLTPLDDDSDEFGSDSNGGGNDKNVGFEGFSELYEFLYKLNEPNGNSAGVQALTRHLNTIKDSLDLLSKCDSEANFKKHLDKCRKAKDEAQAILRQYIVRSERHRLDKGKELVDKTEICDISPEALRGELETFRMLTGYLQPDGAMMYTKLSPFPMSFCEGYQTFSGIKNVPEEFYWDGKEQPAHFRYQALCDEVFGDNEADIMKLLWLPPSDRCSASMTKTIVFVRHVMSTKSIAALMSAKVSVGEGLPDIPADIPDNVFVCPGEKDVDLGMNDGEPVTCIYSALEGYVNEGDRKKHAFKLARRFYGYLKQNKAVLARAGVTDKNSLKEYCRIRWLTDVLKEYFFVLTKGFEPLDKNSVGEWSSQKLDDVKAALSPLDYKVSYFSGEGKTAEADCLFACRFNQFSANNNKDIRSELRRRFNSPFYPFVLVTTPIAQEGLNLHDYCHRVFHWKVPGSPIDYEQREGRINRYRNHACRKNAAAYCKKNSITPSDWGQCFNSCKTSAGGMSPDWFVETDGDGDFVKLLSRVVFQPCSREEEIANTLDKLLNSYRLSLGYGVSAEVVNGIEKNAKELGIAAPDFKELLIDLSPDK